LQRNLAVGIIRRPLIFPGSSMVERAAVNR
jgi:hypothetical protein